MSKQEPKDPKDLNQEDVLETNDDMKQEESQVADNEGDVEIDVDDKLNQLETQKSELQNKYLRLLAEFDNYKKRTARQQAQLIETAAKDTMTALLPVLDDFDRAHAASDGFSEGVNLVYQKLATVLKQRGLEAMESNGQPFDAELHEAFTEIPAPNDDMKGKVVDTIEKGYTLKGNIIRYAKVVVGK